MVAVPVDPPGQSLARSSQSQVGQSQQGQSGQGQPVQSQLGQSGQRQPSQGLTEQGQEWQSQRPARPATLRGALLLLLVAGLPFLLLGGAALTVPAPRWLRYTGPWPLVHTGQVGYRMLGAAMLLVVLGFLALALLAYRRRWARTSVTAFIAVSDVTLALVLLSDRPRLGWLLFGAAVLGCSLAAVVRGYQPEVDRYLADEAAHSY